MSEGGPKSLFRYIIVTGTSGAGGAVTLTSIVPTGRRWTIQQARYSHNGASVNCILAVYESTNVQRKTLRYMDGTAQEFPFPNPNTDAQNNGVPVIACDGDRMTLVTAVLAASVTVEMNFWVIEEPNVRETPEAPA